MGHVKLDAQDLHWMPKKLVPVKLDDFLWLARSTFLWGNEWDWMNVQPDLISYTDQMIV